MVWMMIQFAFEIKKKRWKMWKKNNSIPDKKKSCGYSDTKPHAMTTFDELFCCLSHFYGHWSYRFGNRDIRLHQMTQFLSGLSTRTRRSKPVLDICENRAISVLSIRNYSQRPKLFWPMHKFSTSIAHEFQH